MCVLCICILCICVCICICMYVSLCMLQACCVSCSCCAPSFAGLQDHGRLTQLQSPAHSHRPPRPPPFPTCSSGRIASHADSSSSSSRRHTSSETCNYSSASGLQQQPTSAFAIAAHEGYDIAGRLDVYGLTALSQSTSHVSG